MSYVTRDLLSMALSRNAGELVVFITKQVTASGDGSYAVEEIETEYRARVVDLQQNEINRLALGGITVQSGVSISIPYVVEKIPDQVIRSDGTLMKIIKATVSENATVMIADVPPFSPAVEE